MLTNIIAPLRRGPNKDFEIGSDITLIERNIKQILATRCSSGKSIGEIPWRPSFGSRIDHLRHSSNSDAIVKELARTYTVDAIRKWEPRARLTFVDVSIKNVDNSRKISVIVRFTLQSLGRLSGTEFSVLATI